MDQQYSFSLRNIDKKRGSQNNIHDQANSSSLSNYMQLDKTIQKNMGKLNSSKNRRTPTALKTSEPEVRRTTEECLEGSEKDFNRFTNHSQR